MMTEGIDPISTLAHLIVSQRISKSSYDSPLILPPPPRMMIPISELIGKPKQLEFQPQNAVISPSQPHDKIYSMNACLPCRNVHKKCTLPGKDCSNCGNESCVFDHSPRKNRRVGNLNRQTERLLKTLRRTQTNRDNNKENLNHIQKDFAFGTYKQWRIVKRKLKLKSRRIEELKLKLEYLGNIRILDYDINIPFDTTFYQQTEVQCNIYKPQYRNYARDSDYVQQETLREYLQNNHSKLTLNDRITLFKTLCASLHYIHDRGLIYRNLHSGKVLVQAGKCYITDLGSCGPVDGKNEKDGMIPYIAPEVLRKRSKNTKESDVYGIGMLMWEIFSGGPPFDNMIHDHCLILEICKEDLRPPILPNMPEEYAEMMQECWDVNPSKRPTIGELYEFARDFSANVYDVNNNNSSFVDHNTHNNVDNSINNMNKTHQNPTNISNNNMKNLYTCNSFDNNNNNLDTAFDDNQAGSNFVYQLQNLQNEKITWKDKIMSLFWIYYELLA